MPLPNPDLLFDRLAPRLPEVPAGAGGPVPFPACWRRRRPSLWGSRGWARRCCWRVRPRPGQARPAPAVTASSVSRYCRWACWRSPFGFAMASPDRALAAMFPMFALTVLTILGKAHVSIVTGLTAAAFLAACIFPDCFSILAYTIGIIVFIWTGQCATKGWA